MAGTVFSDNFSLDAQVNPASWNYVQYQPVNNPSFFGRTQTRQSLPALLNGSAHLTLDTFDPTGPGNAFVGTDIYTSQTFSPGTNGIAIQVIARLDQSTGGLVGGIFPYILLSQASTDHNEIDTELVSNSQNNLSVNNYSNEPLGTGHPQTVSLPVGDSLTQWAIYTTVWLPNQISWYVNGNLVAQTTSNVPSGPMPLYLDFWAPDGGASGWDYAYNSLLQPVSSAAANTTFGFDVQSVLITQLTAPGAIPSDHEDEVTNYVLAPTDNDQVQIEDNTTGTITVEPPAQVAGHGNTVQTIQTFSFPQGSVAFDPTGNAETIARFYEATDARQPDLGGLTSYAEVADSGQVSLTTIAQAFATSPEFIADYGQLSNSDFVTRMYLNLLHRNPDPGGLAGYTADLNGGESRGAVLADMAQSFEARQDWIGTAGNASDAEVYRLYRAIVDRNPDPGGWASYSADLSAGQTIQEIASAMLQSGEYLSAAGSLDNAGFVQRLYTDLLNRPADPGGLASYVSDLNNGESRAVLVGSFTQSSEARLVTAPATHDGWVSIS